MKRIPKGVAWMDVPVAFTAEAPAERGPATPVRRPRRDVPGLRDRLWGLLVRATDVGLRRWYGVREFTDDPACLLRLALAPAPHAVSLSDGTRIEAGETIAVLHIWNEQIPRFRRAGPDLGWAIGVRRRLLRSFAILARHLEHDPAWRDVRGIHACITFGSRRRRAQIRRAASRFGFDLIEEGAPAGLHEFGENFLIWALTRGFNPSALRRQPFLRDRTEVWISRQRLLGRYL
jgi:hypothetical protein